MKFPRTIRIKSAFTLTELLVVLGIVAIVVLLLIPPLYKAKSRANRISCVSHLKNIGLAFRTFAVDYRGLYPWQTNLIVLSSGQRTTSNLVSADLILLFSSISNEISTPKILVCPSDIRGRLQKWTFTDMMTDAKGRHLVPSYFVGLNTSEEVPESILSGDRNVFVRGKPEFDWSTVTETTPAWRLDDAGTNAPMAIEWDSKTIHKAAGNILLGDGSVQQTSSGRLQDAVRDARRAAGAMTWLMPVDH